MKIIHKIFSYLIGFVLFYCGIIVAFLGMLRFILLDENSWVDFVLNIPDDRQIIISIIFLGCGLYTATTLAERFISKTSKKIQNEQD